MERSISTTSISRSSPPLPRLVSRRRIQDSIARGHPRHPPSWRSGGIGRHLQLPHPTFNLRPRPSRYKLHPRLPSLKPREMQLSPACSCPPAACGSPTSPGAWPPMATDDTLTSSCYRVVGLAWLGLGICSRINIGVPVTEDSVDLHLRALVNGWHGRSAPLVFERLLERIASSVNPGPASLCPAFGDPYVLDKLPMRTRNTQVGYVRLEVERVGYLGGLNVSISSCNVGFSHTHGALASCAEASNQESSFISTSVGGHRPRTCISTISSPS